MVKPSSGSEKMVWGLVAAFSQGRISNEMGRRSTLPGLVILAMGLSCGVARQPGHFMLEAQAGCAIAGIDVFCVQPARLPRRTAGC